MDNDYIETIHNNFNEDLIKINEAALSRLKLGFIITDCNFIKSILGVICIHALENPVIFDESRFNNIITIINKISYE